MALSARTPAGADTAGGIPEYWSQKLIDEAQKQLVCWDAITHTWEVGKKKGDTCNIPVTNHTTAATEVVVGIKAASDDIATGSMIQLIMNQWYEKPIDIDTMTREQSQIDWDAECKKEAEYAIRVRIDTTVASLFSALNAGTVKGTDGSEVTDDLLLDVKELLDEADVPLDNDRFIIGDPSFLRDLMVYDKFVAAQYGALVSISNGNVGKSPIYGCGIRITNNLVAASTGAYAVMMHRSAIAGSIQMIIPWVKAFEELHQIRFQHEALWGVKEVRDTFGIPFYTRKA